MSLAWLGWTSLLDWIQINDRRIIINIIILPHSTMSYLNEVRIPIMDVWGELMAIGRLMHHAVQLPPQQQMQDSGDGLVVNGSVGQRTAANEDMQWIV